MKPYAKVLVTNNKIKFMDEKGKLKSEHKRTDRLNYVKGSYYLEHLTKRRADEIQLMENEEDVTVIMENILWYGRITETVVRRVFRVRDGIFMGK